LDWMAIGAVMTGAGSAATAYLAYITNRQLREAEYLRINAEKLRMESEFAVDIMTGLELKEADWIIRGYLVRGLDPEFIERSLTRTLQKNALRLIGSSSNEDIKMEIQRLMQEGQVFKNLQDQ
jgi:hypothetical protein